MAEATLSSKNQIVIPKEAREALGVKPGDKLLVVVEGDTVTIRPKPKSYHEAIRGLMKSSIRTDIWTRNETVGSDPVAVILGPAAPGSAR